MKHVTVLKDEAIAALALTPDAFVVDCTYGGGGHSTEILQSLSDKGRLIAFDADATAFAAQPALEHDPRVTPVVGNFRTLASVLETQGVMPVDAILADLGWRSEQFSGGGKGFSFNDTEPLLMTFGDPEAHTFTAYDVVNEWEEESIADIIYGYSEERGARLIARAIVAARTQAPIETATALADIIESAVGHFYKAKSIHAATKTFQAIRIAVNDELGALEQLLTDGFEVLAPGGRMAIISFHSLEDRIIKRAFRHYTHDHKGVLVTKKPITPTDAEITDNPRARSAKLRVIEKI